MKLSLKPLPILQHNLPPSLLKIMLQFPLIVHPLLFQIVEVGIVKGIIQHGGVVIINLAGTVELVLLPVALVSEAAITVKEFAVTVHPIVLPLALVAAALVVVQAAIAVALLVLDVAFVSTAAFVLLDDVLGLLGVR
jgi:hypothetical protein